MITIEIQRHKEIIGKMLDCIREALWGFWLPVAIGVILVVAFMAPLVLVLGTGASAWWFLLWLIIPACVHALFWYDYVDTLGEKVAMFRGD